MVLDLSLQSRAITISFILTIDNLLEATLLLSLRIRCLNHEDVRLVIVDHADSGQDSIRSGGWITVRSEVDHSHRGVILILNMKAAVWSTSWWV